MSTTTEARLNADLAGTIYEHVRELASGGMAEVHVVRHRELGTLAVMKVLHVQMSQIEGTSERLRAEARLLTRLLHENIVAVRDFGWTKSRRAFLVTELLEGESLGDRVGRDKVISCEESVDLMLQTLAGLAVAHDAGVVHRDIKPHNIFLESFKRPSGFPRVKVIDFGIAKLMTAEGKAAAGGPRTATGTLMGTPAYLAPEQAQGDPIDARTDIYAIGCTLFRMLVGRPPFPHKSAIDVIGAHIMERPKAPSSVSSQPVPTALDAVVLRALAKLPEERFQSANEMTQALRDALADKPRPMSPRQTIRMEQPSASAPSTEVDADAHQEITFDPAVHEQKTTRLPDRPSAQSAEVAVRTAPLPATTERAEPSSVFAEHAGPLDDGATIIDPRRPSALTRQKALALVALVVGLLGVLVVLAVLHWRAP